jgi:hypothetical protein
VRAVAGFVLLVLFLAGCSGGGPGGPGSSTSLPPATTVAPSNTTGPAPAPAPPAALSASNCQIHPANIPVDPAVVQPYLPEGFVPAPLAGFADAVMVLAFSDCAQVVSGGGAPFSAKQFVAYIPVNEPGGYHLQNATGYRAVLSQVTDSPELAEVFAAWNVSILTGSVTAAASGTDQAQTLADGVGGPYTVSATAALASIPPGPAALLRFLYIQNRTVQGVADMALASPPVFLIGPVSYQLGAGTPFPAGSGGGYTANYLFRGVPAYTLTPAHVGTR